MFSTINNNDHILPFSICSALCRTKPVRLVWTINRKVLLYITAVARWVMFEKHPTEVPPNILYYIHKYVCKLFDIYWTMFSKRIYYNISSFVEYCQIYTRPYATFHINNIIYAYRYRYSNSVLYIYISLVICRARCLSDFHRHKLL